MIVVDDLEMDIGSRRVSCASGEVDLTGAEFAVLETLARAAGTVVSRDELSRRALGRRASAFDRSLDVHLSNLRRKLGPAVRWGRAHQDGSWRRVSLRQTEHGFAVSYEF